MPRHAPTVYRTYDEADRLLYVGVTDNVVQRLCSHKNMSPWMNLGRTYSTQEFRTRGLAERAEYYAIEREGPLYNEDRSDCFQGTALQARAAIPAGLERRPLGWPVRQMEVVWPSRLVYAEFGGSVVHLTADQARALADRARAKLPKRAAIFDGEHAGVPAPWGDHAIVAYCLRKRWLKLDDVG